MPHSFSFVVIHFVLQFQSSRHHQVHLEQYNIHHHNNVLVVVVQYHQKVNNKTLRNRKNKYKFAFILLTNQA